MMNRSNKDKIPESNFTIQEKSKLKPLIQQRTFPKGLPLQNMPIKSCAQSRLNKYPKKCGDTLTKVVINDKDYIDELKTYLEFCNLPEPLYECMVKKEKFGNTIQLTHICNIKVNEKNVSSSFPVECNTVDVAKNVAAKHALNYFKTQYGEKVVYPITPDVNVMALRIKEFLKQESKKSLKGEVVKCLYTEKFQENLPVNWVSLLEVFSYFSIINKSDMIIISLNETTNDHNSHDDKNFESSVEEENTVSGTSLMLEDKYKKLAIVSTICGSTNDEKKCLEALVKKQNTVLDIASVFEDHIKKTAFGSASSGLSKDETGCLKMSVEKQNIVPRTSFIIKDDAKLSLVSATKENEYVEKHNMSSYLPLNCNTIDDAKNVNTKNASNVLKNHYDEKVEYPFTIDINIMALRIKEFLKQESQKSLKGEVVKCLYTEEFQENLPVNWVSLLEDFCCFSIINKSDMIIISLNETTDDHNSHGDQKLKALVKEEYTVSCTPLMLEDKCEKSALVSANNRSTFNENGCLEASVEDQNIVPGISFMVEGKR